MTVAPRHACRGERGAASLPDGDGRPRYKMYTMRALLAALLLLIIADPSHSWAPWVSPDAPVQPASIRKVHVIQSCHLDVGFVDLAINIINRYFDTFLPDAIAIAKSLAANRTSATSPGLVFTTQSWLISLYLSCPSSFPAPPAEAPAPSPGYPRHNCTIPSHCVTATGCAMAPECRCDCGFPGIAPQQCLASGCCWNGTKSSPTVPECFFRASAPHNNTPPPNPPGPAPAPPDPPASPTQIPLHCPSAAAQADMRQALQDGHIAMQAFPFNGEPEVLDSAMFEWGLNFTAELARANGAPAPTVLSQRDVPSLTRATIPLLVKAGALGINVGINPASAPLGVPSVAACQSDQLATPFVWKDRATNTSVIAAFHPGGYGGIGGDSPNLNCDCLGAPGLDEVLCYGWVGDNGGPPPIGTIKNTWKLLQAAFPNATEIVASTFDKFYEKLNEPAIRSQLEVVTSEAGDTWVYGCSSDPRKMALMRLFMRARRAYGATEGETALLNFSRLLIKASEHTWGSDGKCMTPGKGDTTSWSNADFEKVRPTRLFKQQEDAWHEQRSYFSHALAALGPESRLAAAIKAGIAELDALGKQLQPQLIDFDAGGPPMTSRSGRLQPVSQSEWGNALRLLPATGPGAGLSLNLSVDSGAIISLIECTDSGTDADSAVAACGGRQWASPSQPLGRFVYRSRSYEAGVGYYEHYQYEDQAWGPRVYEKLGVTSATANETTSFAKISALYANETVIVAQLQPPAFISQIYGGPKAIQLVLSLPLQAEGLQMTLSVFEKTTTRLAEEGWMEFRPLLSPSPANGIADGDGPTLVIEKLGSMVDPADLLVNGSRTLHAVGDEQGVVFADKGRRLRLISLDAGLVSPGPAAENMDLYLLPLNAMRCLSGAECLSLSVSMCSCILSGAGMHSRACFHSHRTGWPSPFGTTSGL